jgi:hypothetical protein
MLDYLTNLEEDHEDKLAHLSHPQERELFQEDWKIKNTACYGAIIDVCFKNSKARRVAKVQIECCNDSHRDTINEDFKSFKII